MGHIFGKKRSKFRTFRRTTPNLFILALLSSLYSQHTFNVYLGVDFTSHIGSTSIFLYFDLYLNTAYAAHYTFIIRNCLCARNLICFAICH